MSEKPPSHINIPRVCSVCVVPVEEESRGVVLGAERLDVAVAPLEPSPSAVLAARAAE